MVSPLLINQLNMDQESSNISRQDLENLKKEIIFTYNKEMAKRQTNKDRKRKHSSGFDSDEDLGCLALLKKLTCSLQCGGSTCSIKETEQASDSSKSPTPSMSSASSLESMPLDQATPQPAVASKRRKRQAKKQTDSDNVTEESSVPVVKKARRSSKKKDKQEQQQQQQQDSPDTIVA